MIKYCRYCDKNFNEEEKKCPICGKRLLKQYTEDELKLIRQQNDDMTVIDTLIM